MDESQKQAIKRAYSDLVGAYEAQIAGEPFNQEWKAHLQTICELESEFEFICAHIASLRHFDSQENRLDFVWPPVDLPEEDEDDEVCHN
jgi:hypothetical protein